MSKVYAIVDPRMYGPDSKSNTIFIKGDKVTYKPNHFQVTLGDDVVGSFDYGHKLVDVAQINMAEEGGE